MADFRGGRSDGSWSKAQKNRFLDPWKPFFLQANWTRELGDVPRCSPSLNRHKPYENRSRSIGTHIDGAGRLFDKVLILEALMRSEYCGLGQASDRRQR